MSILIDLLGQVSGSDFSKTVWAIITPLIGTLVGALIAGVVSLNVAKSQAKSAATALRQQSIDSKSELQHQATEAEKSFNRQLAQLDRTFVHQQMAEIIELDRARRIQQLNEFYGPLQALRVASKQVWVKLSKMYKELENKPESYRFRLVDLLPEINESKIYAPLIKEIFFIGHRTEVILRDKSGLIEGEWPESFKLYLGHIALMRAIASGSNPKPGEPGYMADSSFPEQFDDDIDKSAQIVRAKLRELSDVTDRASQVLRNISILVERPSERE